MFLAALAVGLFVALLAYGIATQSPDTDIDDRLRRGETAPAPSFELSVLERGQGPAALADGRLALSELRGTPVVLNFWASWCPPCRTEAPVLEQSWRDNRNDVLFLGLNMQDLTGEARDYLADFGNTYPHVRDPSNDVARDWGVTGLPETFFLSSSGDVVGHVIGAASSEQLRDGIAAATRGRVAGARQGGDRRPTR